MALQLITTKDGSHTLRNTEINDTYHSIHGAIQESRHVFINEGLGHLLNESPSKIDILEVGFGTGLNAYLTLLFQDQIRIEYTAIEAFPISEDIYSQLNYGIVLGADRDHFQKLHQLNWHQSADITDWFSLSKIHGRIEQIELPSDHFDLVYYDAFGPEKQPEMWTIALLERLAITIKPGGSLVTYCSKGQFQRDLKTLGFRVELPPGPPGKFEIVRAVK